MSTTAYNSLLFETSERIDGLNALQRLVFICRGKLAQSGIGNVHDALSLFKEVEEHGYLGVDRLKLMKELLRNGLCLEKLKNSIISEKNTKAYLKRLSVHWTSSMIWNGWSLCRGNIREGNIDNIVDVRRARKSENSGNRLYNIVSIKEKTLS